MRGGFTIIGYMFGVCGLRFGLIINGFLFASSMYFLFFRFIFHGIVRIFFNYGSSWQLRQVQGFHVIGNLIQDYGLSTLGASYHFGGCPITYIGFVVGQVGMVRFTSFFGSCSSCLYRRVLLCSPRDRIIEEFVFVYFNVFDFTFSMDSVVRVDFTQMGHLTDSPTRSSSGATSTPALFTVPSHEVDFAADEVSSTEFLSLET